MNSWFICYNIFIGDIVDKCTTLEIQKPIHFSSLQFDNVSKVKISSSISTQDLLVIFKYWTLNYHQIASELMVDAPIFIILDSWIPGEISVRVS